MTSGSLARTGKECICGCLCGPSDRPKARHLGQGGGKNFLCQTHWQVLVPAQSPCARSNQGRYHEGTSRGVSFLLVSRPRDDRIISTHELLGRSTQVYKLIALVEFVHFSFPDIYRVLFCHSAGYFNGSIESMQSVVVSMLSRMSI
jgi:hypothetical protein